MSARVFFYTMDPIAAEMQALEAQQVARQEDAKLAMLDCLNATSHTGNCINKNCVFVVLCNCKWCQNFLLWNGVSLPFSIAVEYCTNPESLVSNIVKAGDETEAEYLKRKETVRVLCADYKERHWSQNPNAKLHPALCSCCWMQMFH